VQLYDNIINKFKTNKAGGIDERAKGSDSGAS